MLCRITRRRDGGAGAAEYAGLIVLAALILGALVATGIPQKVTPAVSGAVCRILGGDHCATPSGSPSPGHDGDDGNGGKRPGDQNTGGGTPSLADLQDQADQAQRDLDQANDGGDIKQKIIDLLKDFVGITDVEKCLTEGDIASCLWAVFDVGSLFFAALKIGKFVKAVKDAVKLWKDFSRARKVLAGLKTSAKTARDRLKRVAEKCGVPVYGASLAAGTPVVLASGRTKPVESVRVGDRVLARDPGGGRPRPEPVTALRRGDGHHRFVRLDIAANPYGLAGTTLTTTADHLFWAPDRHAWTEAASLRMNERFASADGSRPRIVGRYVFGSTATVYNLTVSGPHTYYIRAGGALLLVHNAQNCGPAWEKVSGMVRDAAKGKGNFGIGRGTRAEADTAGKAWVGPDYKVASDGKTLVSKDGLRQYRPPSGKPRLGKTQANFEQRYKPEGQWQGNGHLDITD